MEKLTCNKGPKPESNQGRCIIFNHFLHLKCVKNITFTCFSDPPWPPGKPTVKDVAKTSCFLMWTKPEHDGGAKIDGYVIEMLKSGTVDWIRVAENISILEHFLKGLMEKQEYSFRVRAVNVAGESDPSEPSDPVLCKERLSKTN